MTTISSGIGRPESSTIVRMLPSTWHDADAGEPLVQAGRVAGQRPHRFGGTIDAQVMPNRAECHCRNFVVSVTVGLTVAAL